MTKPQAKAKTKTEAKTSAEPKTKLVADNRKARHDFEILEVTEVGVALTGTEVKSLRQGKANLQDAFARIEDNEIWLYRCHISPYDFGNRFNHDPIRKRQ